MSTGGCGGGCRCAGDTPDIKKDGQCAVARAPLALDKDGTCPCGKHAEDCCHKDELKEAKHNHALDELCESHDGKSPCGDNK